MKWVCVHHITVDTRGGGVTVKRCTDREPLGDAAAPTLSFMNNRDEVREFLMSRRAKVTPEEAGLPTGQNRRVAGLRRSEVAMLAGVSVEYYARLERGTIAGASASVLDAIARALLLDDTERAHLFDLARAADGIPTSGRPRRRGSKPAMPRLSLQWALDSITEGVAFVRNQHQDLLATNELGRAFYSPLIGDGGRTPNLARFQFLDPAAHDFYPDWELFAQMCVSIMRAEAGRDPYDAKIYTLLTIITDSTPEAARAKAAEYQSYASTEGALVFMSGWMGIDLASYEIDEPIGNVHSNAIQSAVAAFQQASDTGEERRVRDIAAWGGIGGMGPVLIGSGDEVAEALQDWVTETDVDGFNVAYAVTPGSFEDIITHVVPALEKRGLYDRDYVPGTLRHKLFGRGDQLPENHRGSTYRVGGSNSTIDDSIRQAAQLTGANGGLR